MHVKPFFDVTKVLSSHNTLARYSSIKPSCHIPFSGAFSALRSVFLIITIKIICRKMQCNAENAILKLDVAIRFEYDIFKLLPFQRSVHWRASWSHPLNRKWRFLRRTRSTPSPIRHRGDPSASHLPLVQFSLKCFQYFHLYFRFEPSQFY